jgi:hypothetical protein
MTNILHQIQAFFATGLAFLVLLQPFAVPLSGALQGGATFADRKHWLKTADALRALSKICGTFAVVDLGRIIRFFGEPPESRALKNAKRINAEIIKTFPDVVRTLVLLIGLGAVLHSTGCAGTLEETRGSVKMRSLLGAQVAPVNRAECQRLSRLESISTILASGLAFAAGASGVATVPVRSANSKTALAITALSLGALSASSVAAETRFRAEWQQAGCDQ